MIDLTGTSILLTGASRGIGSVTARVLDRAGARVLVHYGASRDAAEALASSLANDPVLLEADLSRAGAGAALWAAAIDAAGTVPVVVNNAGIAPYAAVEDSDEVWASTWERTLQVNLVAVADICRAAIGHFGTIGGGSIINVASRAAFRGDEPNMMHYAASKGGVIALTRSIARGFGDRGVVAYAIAPGWTATEMALDHLAANPDEVAGYPLGEAVPPIEVANTIAFLASGMARHLTGTTIDINGATYVR